MDKGRILALLDAAEMLHQVTARRLVLAERDADRLAIDLELMTPEKPQVVRSFTDLPKCTKRSFGSADAATRSYSGSHTVKAYQCPRCSKYHLTKSAYA